MQFKKTLVRLALFLCYPKFLKGSLATLLLLGLFSPTVTFSQSTYLPQGDKQNILLERLEIKAGNDSVLNFSKTKYFNRGKYVINGVRSFLQKHDESSLSKTDAY